MICRLCLQERELIRKSHLIPSFMYKGILPKGGKIAHVNLYNFRDATLRPTGIYDQYILCAECDNAKLGKYESYAAKVFYNKNFTGTAEEDKEMINLFLEGVDYKKFKLFLLSILWRASISRQSFFSEVDLGKKYDELARKMLIEGNPGESSQFATCVFGLKTSKKLITQTIIAPRRLKQDGNTSYMFFVNGLFYWFNVSGYQMADVFRRTPIDETNKVTVGILKDKWAEEFFDSFIGRPIRRR